MQWLLRGVGGVKDNPSRIDIDNPTKILLYKSKKLCVRHTLHSH
jgi:hypothetical protein